MNISRKLIAWLIIPGVIFIYGLVVSDSFNDVIGATPDPTPSAIPDSYILTVSLLPGGLGPTVDVNPPGVPVGSAMSFTYQAGTVVTLKANNYSSTFGLYAFTFWSGDLTGNQNPASIIMDGNKSVTALYLQAEPTPKLPTSTIVKTSTPAPTVTPVPTITPPHISHRKIHHVDISGSVYDNNTGREIAGASVSLSVSGQTANTVTDTNGYYRIVLKRIEPVSASATLTVRAAGYQIVSVYLTLGKMRKDFYLVPQATSTPAIRMTPTNFIYHEPTPAPLFKVQLYNSSRSDTTNMIYHFIRLVNNGTASIDLTDVKIRYYYTIDGAQPQNYHCDYSTAGSGNVTATFVTMATPRTGADTYLEIGFTNGAGNLAAGGDIVVEGRIAKSNWSNYNQSNDYSFNPTASNFVDWTRATGYISGVLQWGIEP